MTKRAEETRIALFTITRDRNYGNRLQNYALQEVLKSFGDVAHDVVVETVDNKFWRGTDFSYNERVEDELAYPWFEHWQQEKKDVVKLPRWIGQEVLNQQAFHRFERENIQESPIVVTPERSQEAARQLGERYDWGVVGSDQLWNPAIGHISGFDFATCMPENRRVAYAGSFGLRQLPEHMHDWFREHVAGLTQISVREDAAAALVKELTGRKAEVVPDPTLLLPEEIWRLAARRPKGLSFSQPYLLVYPFHLEEPETQERIHAVAREQGLAIVDLSSDDPALLDVGPAEFLWLFDHAAAVITDSFHGTCFAIALGKPFLAVVWPQREAALDRSSRFDTLLPAYGMEGRRVTRAEDITSERLCQDDMGTLAKQRRARRAVGASFLERALPGVGMGKLRLHSVALVRRDVCTGCSACAAACPHQAITMKSEPRGGGFMLPSVDRERCRDCGQCLRTCPVCTPVRPKGIATLAPDTTTGNNERMIDAHLVIAKDDDLRAVSSSGGVFPMLALQMLAKGGVVVGVTAGSAADGWHVHHVAVERAEDLAALFRSKYVQSDKCDTFRQVASYLRAGRDVLFSGTGCEVQGLVRALAAMHQDTTHLLTVDVVCHGVPSPALWGKYMQLRLMLDGQGANDVLGVRFRDKRDGWQRSTRLHVRYRNGAAYLPEQDAFLRLFLQNFCLRGSCYHCPARSRFVKKDGAGNAWQLWRPSDLTLGDFWGIERTDLAPLNDDKGASLVFAASEKGRNAVKALATSGAALVENLQLPEPFLRMFNPNILYDNARPKERAAVMDAIGKNDGMKLLAALEDILPQLFR